jgi:hypothetical protein
MGHQGVKESRLRPIKARMAAQHWKKPLTVRDPQTAALEHAMRQWRNEKLDKGQLAQRLTEWLAEQRGEP